CWRVGKERVADEIEKIVTKESGNELSDANSNEGGKNHQKQGLTPGEKKKTIGSIDHGY
ncbi:hypothetical protein TNCT_533191, partial [Trichonephila clavata]